MQETVRNLQKNGSECALNTDQHQLEQTTKEKIKTNTTHTNRCSVLEDNKTQNKEKQTLKTRISTKERCEKIKTNRCLRDADYIEEDVFNIIKSCIQSQEHNKKCKKEGELERVD